MRRSLPLFLALLACVPCLAQEGELKRVDIFGGYQYAHLFPSENGQGWNMAATANLNRVFGSFPNQPARRGKFVFFAWRSCKNAPAIAPGPAFKYL